MSDAPYVDMTTISIDSRPLRQVRALTLWVADGRALTQTGRIRLADARELVALLQTGDELDPMDGAFQISSSAELPWLSLIVAWAKACRLIRVVRGRLVVVKSNAGLLERPGELWERMFDVFPAMGHSICPDGWAQSFLRDGFPEAIEATLRVAYRRDATIEIAEACKLAWEIATARYLLDGAPEQRRATWRKANDRDVRRALLVLEQLGAMRRDGETMTLTDPAIVRMRCAAGDGAPGDAILQLKISLLGVSRPPVWRRLFVPADIRLDRLHDVIQIAMGWTDSHLHAFSAGDAHYGPPNPDLDHRDERTTKLDDLIAQTGDRMRYTYDFGDDWAHEIRVAKVLDAQPGARYPPASPARAAAHPRTAAAPGDTQHSARCWQTPAASRPSEHGGIAGMLARAHASPGV